MACLLFDLDGTLTETDRLHHMAYRRLLPTLLGTDVDTLDDAWFAATVAGRANRDVWRSLLPPGPSNEELAESMAQKKEDAFMELARLECTPLAGLVELLDFCDEKSVPACVVTNAPRRTAEELLSCIGLSGRLGPDRTVCGMECSHTKPHPAPFHRHEPHDVHRGVHPWPWHWRLLADDQAITQGR